MTKVDIIVDNVESSCIPCCEDLHDLLVDAKNKFKQVNLPFSCDSLNQTENELLRIINLVSEYSEELKSAKEFCLKSEKNVALDVAGIDSLNI